MTAGWIARRVGSLWRTAATLLRRLQSHDVLVLAAAIAYTTILSFFPLLVGAAIIEMIARGATARVPEPLGDAAGL
jgi:uncharacterized BrkB/YihY/UPF0761 family membrane protein